MTNQILYLKIALVLSISISLSNCTSNHKNADLIITNARIWTGDNNKPSAQAMAVSSELIVDIGTNEEILNWKGEHTIVSDLGNAFVTPGFIDSHVHFFTGGFNLSSVQLRDAATPEEFIERIGNFARSQPAGTWILGGDWDHENWGGELPTKEWIDAITSDNPVFVTRLDGHMSLANSLALKKAGITKNIKDITGGTIIRDSSGNPTGIFKDNATSLFSNIIPEASTDQIDAALTSAMNHVASKGVTSVHHMVGYMDALKRAREAQTLITRVYTMMPLNQWEHLKNRIEQEGEGDHWLKIGGLKGFVDGSLGSHTAAFHEPFTDVPSDKGFFVNKEDDLYNWISNADEAGLQVMVHAIGDKAINFLLNTYEKVGKENGDRDRRFRIEHAQHIGAKDISRFSKLKVIPSMQPYHAIDDGRWAEKVIGPQRTKTTYAFRSLLDAGATVAFGSDWFVAPPTPLDGIYAAVTRRTLDDMNPEGWVPEQKISVEEALIAYTKNAAFASFEEDIKGTLTPGKLADFVVIDKDLTTIDPIEIREAKILKTYVGGRVVYKLEK